MQRHLLRRGIAACAASTASSASAVQIRSVRYQGTASDAKRSTASASPSSATTSAEGSGAGADETAAPGHHAAHHVMQLAAAARRDIHALWHQVSAEEASEGAAADLTCDQRRLMEVTALVQKYNINVATPREEDVCRGLGDALDRLLLLCVPLVDVERGLDVLEQVLHVAGRNGRQLTVRTVQHLFARTSSFAEALAVFYALRRCHLAMNMAAYHAMLYSLQRLEEEGWAERFRAAYEGGKDSGLSEQALDFVLRGVDSQLLPENKPWLGRIMFAETDTAAMHKSALKEYDELGRMWVDRYKRGGTSDADVH